MNEKKVFFISVIDKPDTLNRKYSDEIKELVRTKCDCFVNGIVVRGDDNHEEDLYYNLENSIKGKEYEGYIILLDCLDTEKGMWNPNVMFEFGAIKYLDKPFVIISSHTADDYPFDVKPLNIVTIPECVVSKIEECYNNKSTIDYEELSKIGKNAVFINKFVSDVSKQYNNSLAIHKNEPYESVTHSDLKKEILEIKKIVQEIGSTAEYIEGESAAFYAVTKAVKKAKKSLKTSRFANQSIVLASATSEQKDFMLALYDSSLELKEKSDRIICNNNPKKWLDIYYALFNGGNGSKVYIRKNDFSIHFELVVIDEMKAFIHFYQPDHAERKGGDDYDHKEERINSTLMIKGNNICKKLSNIFDRLHHKDFDLTSPQNPSRTLLGIPFDDIIKEKDKNNGCFSVPLDIPENIARCSTERARKIRRETIINMFKKAFQEWSWPRKDSETDDEKMQIDKLNMLVGISLVEESPDFIKEMRKKNIIDDNEEKEASKSYEREIRNI